MENQSPHTLPDEDIVKYLKEKGYITKGILYENPKKINFEIYKFCLEQTDDLYTWVEILVMILQLPILVDDIHDVVSIDKIDNSKRKQIKASIYAYDKGMGDFYQANKLEGSKVHTMLMMIGEIRKLSVGTLSDTLLDRIDTMSRDLCSVPDTFSVDKYIYSFSNSEKLDAVYALTDISEDVIVEIFGKDIGVIEKDKI